MRGKIIPFSQKKESYSSVKNWHRAEILAAIKMKGSSLSKLSKNAGLHERTLYNTLDRPWKKGEQIISDFLGIPPEEIWAERYSKLDK